jgi:site-specific recombinase XerD
MVHPDHNGIHNTAPVCQVQAKVADSERPSWPSFRPAIEKAGLRRFRFHDVRHTFGSLLIQNGASLAYVKEQLGHSSIQVTANIYGHLIPAQT